MKVLKLEQKSPFAEVVTTGKKKKKTLQATKTIFSTPYVLQWNSRKAEQ